MVPGDPPYESWVEKNSGTVNEPKDCSLELDEAELAPSEDDDVAYAAWSVVVLPCVPVGPSMRHSTVNVSPDDTVFGTSAKEIWRGLDSGWATVTVSVEAEVVVEDEEEDFEDPKSPSSPSGFGRGEARFGAAVAALWTRVVGAFGGAVGKRRCGLAVVTGDGEEGGNGEIIGDGEGVGISIPSDGETSPRCSAIFPR